MTIGSFAQKLFRGTHIQMCMHTQQGDLMRMLSSIYFLPELRK
jgi:hypothetical protein